MRINKIYQTLKVLFCNFLTLQLVSIV